MEHTGGTSESKRRSGYEPGEEVRPRAGVETQHWPNLEDRDRQRQLVTEHGLEGGRMGVQEETLLGPSGSLKDIIEGFVHSAQARIDEWWANREAALNQIVARAPIRKEQFVSEGKANDKKIDALAARIDALADRIQRAEAEEQQLSPGQRSGRLVGKEAFVAATATGLGDGSAFVLTLNGIGGELWLRISLAVTLALILNVAIMAAGRTVAAVWRMLDDASRIVRLPLAGGALATLGFLVDRALVTAGAFRHDALVNLENGIATNPAFLVWVAVTGAFGATIALGWWHYASEGDRLVRQRRRLERDRDRLVGERTEAEKVSEELRAEAFAVAEAAREAQQELATLDRRVSSLKAAERAEGDTLFAMAREAYAKGAKERVDAEPEHAVTFEPATEAALDRMIHDILA